jgi:hypothetical protein
VLKQRVIDSCRSLLRPIVSFVLKHGVTWEEFGELAKDAFVEVARQEHGIQGRPTNNSRVAMLTGLSRREVARVRDRLLDGSEGDDTLQGNRLSRILTGWHSDAEFTDSNGHPKLLPETGDTGSFADLLQRYAGDLPDSAVRKEMLQRGLIEEQNDGQFRVLKRDFVLSNLDPELVHQFGLALHDHGATLRHNLDQDRASPRRFEGMADNLRMSRRSYKKFQNLVAARGFSFLEEMDEWLAEHEIDETEDANTRTVRLGVGVYFIYDESEQGTVT